jgi:hypothetical protein
MKPKHPTAAVLQMLMQMDTQKQLQVLPQGWQQRQQYRVSLLL